MRATPAASYTAEQGAAVLAMLLKDTPEAALLPGLLEGSANADSFPYPLFLQWVDRAYQECAEEDVGALADRLRQAMRDRAANGGFDAPLTHAMAGVIVGGVPWRSLHALATAVYGPQARMALVAAQLATTVLPNLSKGCWRSAVAATSLLPLEGMLPALRDIEEVDQLVQSLPEFVREGLWNLHGTLAELDATFTPSTPCALALVALGAVIWRLYEAVSPSPATVHGDASHTLLDLPRQVSGVAQWNRRLANLFAPVSMEARLQQDIGGFIDIKQRLDQTLAGSTDDQSALRQLMESLQAPSAGESRPGTVRATNVLQQVMQEYISAPAGAEGLGAQVSAWLGEHIALLQSGPPDMAAANEVAPSVVTLLWPDHRQQTASDARTRQHAPAPGDDAEPAVSSTGARRAGASWWAWLAPLLPAALGSIRVGNAVLPEQVGLQDASVDAGTDEMDVENAAGLAIGPAVQRVLQGGGGRPGFAARHPGAYTALVGVVGTTATYAAIQAGRALWPEDADLDIAVVPVQSAATPVGQTLSSQAMALPAQRLNAAAVHPVALPSGDWCSAAELTLSDPAPVVARRTGNTGEVPREQGRAPSADAEAGGVSDTLARHNLAVALADDLAKRFQLDWLDKAAEPEKALYALAMHDLLRAHGAINAVKAKQDTLLGEGLRAAGWAGRWSDVVVEMPAKGARYAATRDLLPLEIACLQRTHAARNRYTFLQRDMPLSGHRAASLQRFLEGSTCAQLQASAQAEQGATQQRLLEAARSQLTLDAVEAKIRGVIGPANGAGLVLDFLHGTSDVESASMHFSMAVEDGTQLDITLPGYLVLRRNAPASDEHGQIVVYRRDGGAFRVFKSTSALRDYFDERRAKLDTLAGNEQPWSLAHDLLAAVPAAKEPALRDALKARALRPTDWDPARELRWDFKPSNAAILTDWLTAAVEETHSSQQRQQALAALEWSPAGLRLQRAKQKWAGETARLEDYHDYSRPAVQRYFHTVLRNIDRTLSEPIDPDLIQLQVNNRIGSLTDWATSHWAHDGIQRPVVGTQWPSKDQLNAMQVTVFQRDADGLLSPNNPLTERLSWKSNRRHLCQKLDDLVISNRLGGAYRAYLENVQGTRQEDELVTAQAELTAASIGFMVERARATGQLAETTWKELSGAAAYRGNPDHSPFLAVAVAGRKIPGLWALAAGDTHYVFIADGPHGERVMDTSAFNQWLQRSSEAEAFISQRARYVDHALLSQAFAARRSSRGVPVSFETTRGPWHEAKTHIEDRLADLDELTTSEMERLRESLNVMGTVLVSGACMIGSGGTAMLLCAAGSTGIFLRGVRDGAAAMGSGDTDAAAEAITGAVVDGLDVLEVTRLQSLLFRMGRSALSSVTEARRALRALHRQHGFFDAHGHMNRQFPRATLPGQQPPLLSHTAEQAWPVYRRDGKEYIRPASGGFVETSVDGHGIRMAHETQDRQMAPVPITFDGSDWQRLDAAPDPAGTVADRIRELVPDARALSPAALGDVLAVQGVGRSDLLTAVARSAIETAGRSARVAAAAHAGDPLMLEGTAALAAVWARTPVVNGGLRVDVVPALDSGLRRVALGAGAGPLITLAPEELSALTLPSLIERAGSRALATRLGIDPDAGPEVLAAEVKQRLQNTLQRMPGAIAQDAGQVARNLATMPHAAAVLRGYFPGLSVEEATDLLRADPGLLRRAQRNDPIGRVIADVVGHRQQASAKQHVLDGSITGQDHVSTLAVLLQDVFGSAQTRVIGDGVHIQLQLQRQRLDGVGTRIDTIRFDSNGNVQYAQSGRWLDAPGWEDALDAVLAPHERSMLGTGSLREHIQRAMAARPWSRICAPTRKRSPCDALEGTSRVAPSPGRRKIEDTLLPDAINARRSLRTGLARALEKREAEARAVIGGVADAQRAKITTLSDGELKRVALVFGVRGKKNEGPDAFRQRVIKELDAWRGRVAQLDSKALLTKAKLWQRPGLHKLDAGQRAALGKYVDVVGARDKNSLQFANVVTVEVDLEWKGTPLQLRGRYTSNHLAVELGQRFEPAADPQRIVLKAHPKPGAEIGEVVTDDQFYVHDNERLRWFPEEYLFGMDAWPMGKVNDLKDGNLEFPSPSKMDAATRQTLIDKGFREDTVNRIVDGEYFYEAGFRSCAEAAFFRDLQVALRKLDPDAFSAASSLANMKGLKGQIALYTETTPCGEVCRRRMNDFIAQAPGVQIEIGSSYVSVEAAKPYRRGEEPAANVAYFEPDMPVRAPE